MSDDGVGPAVARLVHSLLAMPRVEIRELAAGGVELMEALIGFDWAVIIDAIVTGNQPPGSCYRVDTSRVLPAFRTGSSHEIGLVEGLEMARRLRMPVPSRLLLFAIEVADPFTFAEQLTPEVARRVRPNAQAIARDVRRECGSRRPSPLS